MLEDLNKEYIEGKKRIAKFFSEKKSRNTPAQRLPPGQREVARMVAMPPIHKEYPHIPKNQWRLRVYKNVENEITLDWESFNKLPMQDYSVDFHCVTHWSKLGQMFSGVPFTEIVKLVKPLPQAQHVIFECADGYATCVPYRELLTDIALIAITMNRQELEDKHGAPARMVIPHLYGWKSAKHLIGIRFQETDELGFWEIRGYHSHGDVWKEERYS